MIFVPPWEIRPIDRRSGAFRGAAFEPEVAVIILPDADRMAVEFLATMQAPPFMIQIGPSAREIVIAKQV